MRKFRLIIPVLNQFDSVDRYVSSFCNLAKRPIDILLIDNGSSEQLVRTDVVSKINQDGHNIFCLRLEKNVGVYPTFQIGANTSEEWEYLFYSHSDVEMFEDEWDIKLEDILTELENNANPGICGMFGARGIGTPDIYKAPYDFRQLMRWDTYTNEMMLHAGGKLIPGAYKRIMVLDGFSLICSRDFIRVVGFNTDDYPVHHNYDNRICLQSHFAGFENYVLNINCIHHGGVTSTREKWAEKMGRTDLEIHREAHRIMYEEFKGRLPAFVE